MGYKMRYKVICPSCGKRAELIDSKEIYKSSHGYGYLCKDCGTYVGCHKGTIKPLGVPADESTRKMRIVAHNAFDRLWKNGLFLSRTDAYNWLSNQLGIPFTKTHIANFDADMCRKVLRISNSYEDNELRWRALIWER